MYVCIVMCVVFIKHNNIIHTVGVGDYITLAYAWCRRAYAKVYGFGFF